MTSTGALYEIFKEATGVTIDSRKVEKGFLFFALKGEKTDGNHFAQQAVQDGAIAAVVDDPGLEGQAGCYLVKDVLYALQQLAGHHRNNFNFPVIGLTGSNGKTTSKELLHAVLQSSYRVQATKGNLNNHIGVPLTLLSVRTQLDYLIVEMGANHQGEIQFLSELARPDIGYITNIGKAHLEGFGGVEGVKKGKSELYRYIANKNGILFVNGEDEILKSLLPNLPEENIHYYFPTRYLADTPDTFLHFLYEGKGYPTRLVGQYNLDNIASAIAIGEYAKVPSDKITEAITHYEPTNNRSQWTSHLGNHLILDAYNANPSSMKASIDNFGKSTHQHKVIFLGDMFELGEYALDEHRDLVVFTRQYSWYKAVFIGKNFLQCKIDHPDYIFYESVEEAKSFFNSLENKDATILLKGSRGIALEKLLSV